MHLFLEQCVKTWCSASLKVLRGRKQQDLAMHWSSKLESLEARNMPSVLTLPYPVVSASTATYKGDSEPVAGGDLKGTLEGTFPCPMPRRFQPKPGHAVTDRVLHDFERLEQKDGRWRVRPLGVVVKKTLEIETR
jgi:hypothetical protein